MTKPAWIFADWVWPLNFKWRAVYNNWKAITFVKTKFNLLVRQTAAELSRTSWGQLWKLLWHITHVLGKVGKLYTKDIKNCSYVMPQKVNKCTHTHLKGKSSHNIKLCTHKLVTTSRGVLSWRCATLLHDFFRTLWWFFIVSNCCSPHCLALNFTQLKIPRYSHSKIYPSFRQMCYSVI